MRLCSGDIGFGAWKATTSRCGCPGRASSGRSAPSAYGDFQARRASIRFRPAPKQKPQFVHTLNGSGLFGADLVAILENHQQADGTVRLPKCCTRTSAAIRSRVSRLAYILALLPATAWANGQTTHVWITLEAIHLDEGPVLDLLARTEMRDPLVNGAMFPDGGYAVGDDYGELAHWEPFQQAYLGWIRDTYDPPYDRVKPPAMSRSSWAWAATAWPTRCSTPSSSSGPRLRPKLAGPRSDRAGRLRRAVRPRRRRCAHGRVLAARGGTGACSGRPRVMRFRSRRSSRVTSCCSAPWGWWMRSPGTRSASRRSPRATPGPSSICWTRRCRGVCPRGDGGRVLLGGLMAAAS